MGKGQSEHSVTGHSQGTGETLEALTRLYRLSEEPVTQILDLALEEILQLTGSSVGYIYFFDENSRLFTLYSWSKGVMDSCSIVEKKTTYELDKTGIWGEAVRKRQPIIVNDFEKKHPLKKGYPEGHVVLKNFLTLPVFHVDSIVSVIGVGNKNGDYSNNDVLQLELVAKGVWTLVLLKQAEEELKTSKEMNQIQLIMDATPIPVFYRDISGRHIGCNNAFESFFGSCKKDFAENTEYELFDKQFSDCIKAHEKRILKEHDSRSFESEITVRGEIRSVIVKMSAYRNSDGVALGSIGVIADLTENKRIEKSLKKALDFNETILEHAAVGIAVYNAATGRCVLANQSLATTLGTTVEVLLSQNFRELDTWKTTGRLELAERVLAERMPVKADKKFVSSFGKEVFLECTFAAFETGGELFLLRADRDISEQKRLEEEIQAQLIFVQTLVDAVPSPMYYKDAYGHFVWCNHAYEELRGFRREEMSGKTAYDFFSHDVADFHTKREKGMFSSGNATSYETQTTTRDGSALDIIYNKAPIFNVDGSVRGLVAVMTDITERKRAEEELREREATFKKILEGVKAGILIIDPKTFTILDVNAVAETMLGESKERIIGTPCTRFKWVREADGAVEESCPVFAGNLVNEDYRLERSNGTTIPVTKTVISAVRNKQLLFFEILFDMSDRKTLERQLALAQRLESIGGLATGIAHEINTPIQYIGDNLSFLEGAFSDLFGELQQSKGIASNVSGNPDLGFLLEEIPKALTQSREGVAHVAGIVSAMKRFAHIGGEDKSLLNVPNAVQNTIMISRNEWKYHSEVQLELDPSLQSLSCFPGDFNQVLLNLLVNASHAIATKYKDLEEKGTITIKTRRVGDWFELSVSDTGCGIPEKNLDRIFDPFFTTKEVGKGTGQGLALCHDIVVKKHGGTIDVQSELGKGTTFTLRFPLQDNDVEKQ